MNRVSSFARDLVQDLRDRNLLIPAIVLLAAIVAVPVVLGSGGGTSETSSTTPAAPVAPDSTKAATEVTPVVLAEVPGLRDYRKRLHGKNGRNPFIQQKVDRGSDSGSDSSGSGGSGGSGSGGGSGDSSSTGATSTSTGTSTTPSTPPDTTTGGSSNGSNGSSNPPQSGLVKRTIDVRIGRAGDTKVLRDVDPLTLLPDEKKPVAQYVNSTLDGKVAAFVVSPSVTSTSGDGKCRPNRTSCQYLALKPGELQKLVYGEDQEVYRIELIAIHQVLIPFDAPEGRAAGSGPTRLAFHGDGAIQVRNRR